MESNLKTPLNEGKIQEKLQHSKTLVSPPIEPESGLLNAAYTPPFKRKVDKSLTVAFTKYRKPISRKNSSENITIMNSPTVPARAVMDYFEYLTDIERKEIYSYETIYFLGLGCDKNYGYPTNDEGYYKSVIGDHLAYRYEIKSILGIGAFGEVLKCLDHKINKQVAIKVNRNQPLYREAGNLESSIIDFLWNINSNQSKHYIIEKFGSFEFRGHLCLVFELLSLNLHEFCEKFNSKGLPFLIVHRIALQLLMGLKIIHSANIFHCDLKLDNILLKNENESHIKIIDFGSAWKNKKITLDYIQSRPYRAPEIVIEAEYGKSIDIWSLGCILVEIITGKQLFPAISEQQLFIMYIEVLGYPSMEFLNTGKRKKYYIQPNGRMKIKASAFARGLRQILEGVDEDAIDFIEKCLQWNPEDRIDAENGLRHPWIAGFHKDNIE